MFLSFLRGHRILCAVFAVLLLLVAGMAALILTEMNRQDIGAGELAEVLADGTET